MLLEPSNRKGKRFKAVFANGKTIHFGLAGGNTYIDEGNKAKRDAYIARHKVNEKWDNPYTAGALSRWLLWGDYTDLEKNHRAFMKRYKVQ